MNSPETAPRDKLILGDFGWPWPLPCIWNPVSQKWAVAVYQISWVDGVDDPYFETDYELPSCLRGWIEMPKLKPSKIKQIKTEEENEVALKRLDEIFDAEPGTPEGEEAELLTTLIETYEKETYL